MAVSRSERGEVRRELVADRFSPDDAEAALDLLELMELAWHDCYGEITPPDSVVDDVLIISRGDIASLVKVVRAAVEDFRDMRLRADAIRDQEGTL